MKDYSWDDCIDNNNSIRVTSDVQKAKSLMETAEERVRFLSGDLNEKTANYIFEGYYSSILELLYALVLLEGYKVLNRICLGNYLRDVVKRHDLFSLFDDCRFKRNSLVYYGNRMDFESAKNTIEKAKRLIRELDKSVEIKIKENRK